MFINKFVKQFENMNTETQDIIKNQILNYFTEKYNSELFKKIKIFINDTIKSSIIDIITNNIIINNTHINKHFNIKYSNKKNIIKYIIKILNVFNINIINVFEILHTNTLYELKQKKIILKLIKKEMHDYKFTYDVEQFDYLININFTILFKNITYNLKYRGDKCDSYGKNDEYTFTSLEIYDEYQYIIKQIFMLDYVFQECLEWSNEYYII